MVLQEVNDLESKKEFLEFPSRLYENDKNWIRPLDKDIEAVFDARKNKYFEHGEATRWILKNSKAETIGRVAAFVNDKTKNLSGQPTGGMGFFECIEDQEAAFILFNACRDWLIVRGVEAMDGPINFGERDKWWGLLVDGFTPPNYGMFYHKKYYKDFFESYGFKVYFKQYTCWKDISVDVSKEFYQKKARIDAEEGYSFSHADKNNLEKLAVDFHTVYTKAWGGHEGISEMSLDKARAIANAMKPVMDDRLLWFAYYHGEPVGFFIMLPELNQIFKHVNGKLDWKGIIKFLWYKFLFDHFKKKKKMFGVVFGIVPEHRNKGLEAALILATRDTVVALNYTDIEMNWIGDFNPKMLAVIRALGARIIKTHVTYRKLFDASKPFERYPIIK